MEDKMQLKIRPDASSTHNPMEERNYSPPSCTGQTDRPIDPRPGIGTGGCPA